MTEGCLTNIPRDIFSAAYQACRARLRALPQAWRHFRITLIGTGSPPPVAFSDSAQLHTPQKSHRAIRAISNYKVTTTETSESTLQTAKQTFQNLIEHYQNILDKPVLKFCENTYLEEDDFKLILEEKICGVNEAIEFLKELNINYESKSEMKFLNEHGITKQFVSALCSALAVIEAIKNYVSEYCKEYNKDTDMMNEVTDKYFTLKFAIDNANFFQQSESYKSRSEEATGPTKDTLISLSEAMRNASKDYDEILESPAYESVLEFRKQSQKMGSALLSVTNLLDEVKIHFDLVGGDEDIDRDEADLQGRTSAIAPAAEMPEETTLNHRRSSYIY